MQLSRKYEKSDEMYGLKCRATDEYTFPYWVEYLILSDFVLTSGITVLWNDCIKGCWSVLHFFGKLLKS